MIKLEDLLKEAEQEQLDEASLGKWLAGAAIGLGSMFSSGKAQTDDTLKLNISTLFPSGKHIIHDKTKLKGLEAQIAGFMSKDPTADYTFRITAMSSKVPDYDGEKPSKPKVDAKFLPHERATEVQEELEEFVQNAKEAGAFKGNVTFQVIEKPGEGPEWHPEKGDKKDDEKFTQHQGVKLDVIAHVKDKPDGEGDGYSIKGSDYETIYLGTRSWAAMAYVSNVSQAQHQSGQQDTRQSDVLVRVYSEKKLMDTRRGTLPGARTPGDEAMSMDIYTDEAYLIPSAVWNKTGGRILDAVPSAWKAFKVSLPSKVSNNFEATYSTSQDQRDAVVKKLFGR